MMMEDAALRMHSAWRAFSIGAEMMRLSAEMASMIACEAMRRARCSEIEARSVSERSASASGASDEGGIGARPWREMRS